ncbi:MAG: murein hydrolase activator EnvC family protein [Methanosarcinaceae archaeon]
MKKKLLLITIIITSFIFCSPNLLYGQNQNNDEVLNSEVKELNSAIKSNKNKIKEIKKKQDLYSKNIKNKQNEKANLINQLDILENRLAKANLDIESVEIDINRTNLEIQKTDLEIKYSNEKLKKEKTHIASILKLMYKNSKVGTLEILLINDSLVDFLNQAKHLENINKELSSSLDKLKKYQKKLKDGKEELEHKDKELLVLKENLKNKKKSLKDEQNNKNFIVDQVKNSEKKYQKLLADAKQEQNKATSEIVSLEKTVRQKIANSNNTKLEFNDNGLIWPVTKNFITAYFHDPDYPFRYLFEHSGIDIRAAQGQAMKAAASGYVAIAKDAGKKYSYIMIIHGNGLSTVYGHVSKIYVKEDEYVIQGQTIGLVGGTPGTKGAGLTTTGPHLHFEVRLNGIPVNPLEYL